MRTEVNILDSYSTTSGLFLRVMVVEGDLKTGLILRSDQSTVKVEAIAFSTADSWRKNERSIRVVVVQGLMPKIGDRLMS